MTDPKPDSVNALDDDERFQQAMQQAGQLGAAIALIAQLLDEPDDPGIRQSALDWLIEAKGLVAGTPVWTSRLAADGGVERVTGMVETVRFDPGSRPVVDMTTGNGETLTVSVRAVRKDFFEVPR